MPEVEAVAPAVAHVHSNAVPEVSDSPSKVAFMVVVCTCDFSNPRTAMEATAICLSFET